MSKLARSEVTSDGHPPEVVETHLGTVVFWPSLKKEGDPKVIITSAEINIIATAINVHSASLQENEDPQDASQAFEALPHVFCIPRGSDADLILSTYSNRE